MLGLGLLASIATQPACAQSLASLSVTPTTLIAGGSATGTVTLSGNAPAGGITVSIASNSIYAAPQNPVIVPAGSNSVTFPVTTSFDSSFGTVARTITLTASYNMLTKTASPVVYPVPTGTRLADLSLDPSSSLTFTWNGPTGASVLYNWTLSVSPADLPLNSLNGSTSGLSVATTGMKVALSHTYSFTLTELISWIDPITMMQQSASWSPGAITCTPQKLLVQDNQAVDARYDPRYSTYTLLNHNFGTTAYRGGLFVGNSPDPSRMGRSFLRFPGIALPAGTTLWCTSVNVYFNGALVTNTTGWQVRCIPVPDTGWTLGNLTWATAPVFDPADPSTGPVSVTYNTSSPTPYWVHWSGQRLTGLLAAGLGPCVGLGVSTEASDQAGGITSFLYFAKKEYDSSKAPYLVYATGNAPLSEVYIIFATSPLHSNSSTQATLYLNGLSPMGGTLVSLSKDSSLVTITDGNGNPISSITIPQGAASAVFTVKAGTIPTSSVVNITGGTLISGISDTWPLAVAP